VNIKNYTSGVPIERTIARIEQALAEAGATGIAKEYAAGRLESLSFRVPIPDGRPVDIRLPANHQAVLGTLLKSLKRPRRGTLDRLQEQALRTSWKLMQDWVEVQLSLVRMQQVDVLQVFLPYVWDGRQTFYAALQQRKFLALAPATGTTGAGGDEAAK